MIEGVGFFTGFELQNYVVENHTRPVHHMPAEWPARGDRGFPETIGMCHQFVSYLHLFHLPLCCLRKKSAHVQ